MQWEELALGKPSLEPEVGLDLREMGRGVGGRPQIPFYGKADQDGPCYVPLFGRTHLMQFVSYRRS